MDFYDTSMRIGRTRAPVEPDGAPGVPELLDEMRRLGITGAAVEHAVAVEASPSLGHRMLTDALAGQPALRPAWRLMPDVSARIEAAVVDHRTLLAERVALARVDAKDFCHGHGDEACFAPVLAACQRVHLPVFLDFRQQGDLALFDFHVCSRWPGIPFVIEGCGGYPMHRLVWCLRNSPNLYVSTTGATGHNWLPLMAEVVGIRRVLFGSGWPDVPIGPAIGEIMLSGLGETDRALVAHGNFRRLLDGVGQ